jgi:outer membrane protein assembly factor BamB
MAMLEVHDGHGGVKRVPVARNQTILFGSSPQCDIVLDDPEVLPFHGRLRWRRDKMKVDASPQAEFIELNGRKMATATFRQGDELQLGSCRIFLISAGIEVPPKPESPPLDDEPTRVQLPPVLAPAPRPASRPPGQAELAAVEAPLIAEDFALEPEPELLDVEIVDDEDDEPPAEPPPLAPVSRPQQAAPVRPAPLPRSWRSRSKSLEGGLESDPLFPPVTPRARPPQRPSLGWGGLVRALRSQDMPPGEERIFTSPLVVTLLIALVFLLLASGSLWGIIQRTIATRLYNQAVDNLNDGDYRNALLRYDEFLSRYPGDARASKAKVLRAVANIRQFTATTGASWTDALAAEREMVRLVSREPAYRDSSTELAELVLQTALGLADRARNSADAATLADAEAAVALHAKVSGKPAATLLARSRVPARLAEARAAVRKAATRAQALAAMDAAIKGGSSAGVYAARDALVGRYADLAEDRALIARMREANELIRRAVRIDTSGRPAETEPQADPLGPATSLVLRTAGLAPAPPARRSAVVHALADGFAYGLSASDGAPLWQLPVGLSAPFPPQAITGSPAALLVDARFDALVKVNAGTGSLLWRQALAEPVSDPPLVLGNQVIQPTPGGKLHLIDLESGTLRATVDLGLPLGRTPANDETGQFLYVLAEKDCLFVLRRDPLSCVAVEYLGHAPGSVLAPPARLGRYLLVAENNTLRDSRWRVFVIDEEGTRVHPVQQIEVPGWTWSMPASSGSVLWATGDRASATPYAVGTYDQKAPLRPLARLDADVSASGPAFAIAPTERELLVGSGRSARLVLDAENGKLAAAWTLAEAGPALAPPQLAGDLLVLTQQATESAGVGLWGVEPSSGSVRWRTILGAPWRVAPTTGARGDALVTLGEDGRPLELTPERLVAGGFLEVPLPKPGGTRLPPGPLARLESPGSDLTVLVPAGSAGYLLVRVGGADLRRLELPAPLDAAPLFWGGDLLVPGAGGRVDLLDPRTGEARAEPYIEPFDRAHPVRWHAPVALGSDAVALADRSGRVRRLTRSAAPRPRFQVSAETSLGSELMSDPLGLASAVILVTADDRIRALAARDLSPIGAWDLEAPLGSPPTNVAGRGFLADVAGNVIALGPDGQRLWTINLRAGAAAGPPAVIGDSAWFLTRTGALERHALADGALSDRLELDILPVGDLQTIDSRLVVPVGLGTLRTLKGEP